MTQILQKSVLVITAVAIVSWISTAAIVLPPAVYANKDEGNPSSSGDDCKSDELPASIDGKISCMEQGECYSGEFEFDGKEKEVKNCNFMMSTE
ncbi:MAG TPA: hypothetical protein VE548_04855 [Nitrososphaeraceae archaeon]|jgi:hypothetical protein|nr:hypothetical protein [Nitrososphaeraceae archaeon]